MLQRVIPSQWGRERIWHISDIAVQIAYTQWRDSSHNAEFFQGDFRLMRVLIIGSGAREHALCWAMHHSPSLELLACLPGNGGTAALAVNVPLDPMDFAACADWAVAQAIDLTIVGPDDPLGGGIVDAFQSRGLRCFGPTCDAARIESSKIWAKAFMARHGIPTAATRVIAPETLDAVIRELRVPEARFPLVVKVDGLAAGKGVIIAKNIAEAEEALRAILLDRRFGAAGAQALIEEFMVGREASVFAICDGASYRILGTACDHKRAYDGDEGPNTGGMGAYAPAGWLTADDMERIEREIIAPTVAGMAADDVPFTGFLYAGLMMTADGPRVVEFNARFGDPEAQVVLPLLESSLLDLCDAAVDGVLASQPPLAWRDGSACGVVIATRDYPTSGAKGLPITGLDTLDDDILTFQGGTRLGPDDALETNGGRVLTIVGLGSTLDAARAHAYANVERVHFDGARYRSDIAVPRV